MVCHETGLVLLLNIILLIQFRIITHVTIFFWITQYLLSTTVDFPVSRTFTPSMPIQFAFLYFTIAIVGLPFSTLLSSSSFVNLSFHLIFSRQLHNHILKLSDIFTLLSSKSKSPQHICSAIGHTRHLRAYWVFHQLQIQDTSKKILPRLKTEK